MIRPLRRFSPMLCAVLCAVLCAALLSAGCGALIVGGPSGPYDVSAPRGQGAGQGGKISGAGGKNSGRPAVATVFRAASAVTAGPGDTVYALSRRHGAPVRAIIEANGLKPPFHLRVGQRIVLPRPPAHRVKPGETLYAIAGGYGVSPYEIARANSLKPPYIIRPGEVLVLPSGAGLAPAPPKPKPVQSAAAPAKAKAQTAPQAKSKPKAQAAVRAPQPPPPKPAAAPPPKASGKGFMWPVSGPVLSNYGAKSKGLFNDGVNIAASKGAPVHAADSGVVAYAGNELKGFGNLILVRHAGGWVTAYAHTDTLLVKRGQKVKRGEPIATVGATGGVTRPQLHFEIRKGRKAVNPSKKLPKRSA
ncbi:MAG: peptidoglycan DD-metalloendopeptidase family protein [Rhodospirillales bacterium]